MRTDQIEMVVFMCFVFCSLFSFFLVGSLRMSCDMCTPPRPGRHAQYSDAAKTWEAAHGPFYSSCVSQSCVCTHLFLYGFEKSVSGSIANEKQSTLSDVHFEIIFREGLSSPIAQQIHFEKG